MTRYAVRRNRGVSSREAAVTLVDVILPAELFGVPNASTETLGARIRAVEAELCALKARQREELASAITATIPPGVAFSARELFDYRLMAPALAAAFDDCGICTCRILGKRLRQMRGLARVGADEHGAIWMVT